MRTLLNAKQDDWNGHLEGRSYDVEEKDLQGFFKTIRKKKEIE